MKPEELETPRVNYKHMKLNLFKRQILDLAAYKSVENLKNRHP